jgi:pimeloyl-ACP methyl ester carboxylesterase
MEPLLLIHGTGADASAWDSLLPLLADRYRPIAYDRHGYGRPHAAHAEDARAILDERAPGQAALVVGWSAGAIVALELAALHPSRVRGLVLLEPPLWAKRAFAPALMAAMLRVAWHTARKRPRDAAAAFFRTVTRYRDGGNGFDALAPPLRERLLGHADDVLAELRSGTGEALTPARLRAISCPATLVLGGRSLPMFAQQGRKLAAAMPSMRTVTVAEASHLMMLEVPRPIAEAIIAADTARTSSPAA